jgi:hypothetical protein
LHPSAFPRDWPLALNAFAIHSKATNITSLPMASDLVHNKIWLLALLELCLKDGCLPSEKFTTLHILGRDFYQQFKNIHQIISPLAWARKETIGESPSTIYKICGKGKD